MLLAAESAGGVVEGLVAVVAVIDFGARRRRCLVLECSFLRACRLADCVGGIVCVLRAWRRCRALFLLAAARMLSVRCRVLVFLDFLDFRLAVSPD